MFTEADAQTLVSFATQNHLGRLAFWSVDRDQPCDGSVSGLPACSEISQQPLDSTKIFLKYGLSQKEQATARPLSAEDQAAPPCET